MARAAFLLLTALGLICVSACSEAPHTLKIPAKVTHVEVTGRDGSKVLKRIDNPDDVQRIVRFLDAHRKDWKVPWAGVPVPRLTAQLYDGEKFVGHFGVGPGFFESTLAGDGFYSRDASDSETKVFLALIGMQGAALKD